MEGKEGMDALFLHAAEGILVANDKGEITRTNPSIERLFGYDKNELIGKKIEVLIPKRLTDRHAGHREKYSHHPHARSMGAGVDLYGLKKDGSELPVEISLSPYSTPQGKFVIAFIVDITIRKQAEEKLKNYSTELEKQVKNRTLILEEAIEELEKTKKDLHRIDQKSERHIVKEEENNRSGNEHLTEPKSSISFVQFPTRKRLLFDRIQVLSNTV